MRTHLLRFLTLMLALAVLVSAVACNGGDLLPNTESEESDTSLSDDESGESNTSLPDYESEELNDSIPDDDREEQEETVELEDGEFILSNTCKIVCPGVYRSSSVFTGARTMLRDSIKTLGRVADIRMDDAANAIGGKGCEILVGNTNRYESETVFSGLGINDYKYSVVSEKLIVICGGSPDATAKAVEKFCADILEDNENAILKVGTEYTYSEQYSCEKFYLGDVELSDFTIAIDMDNDIVYAESLAKELGSYTGYPIPVVNYENLTGNEKGVFCIGAFNREGSIKFPVFTKGYNIRFYNYDQKTTICVGAGDINDFDLAMSKLTECLEPTVSESVARVELPTTHISTIDYNFSEEYTPEWILQNKTEEVLSDGVVYTKYSYVDTAGKPYLAYSLVIDPEKNSLYMGSGRDRYDDTPAWYNRQTVAGHMSSAAANGMDVIAGVNGDFFDIEGDYHPTGLAIKEGTVISKGLAVPYLAFTKDGRAVIGRNGKVADTESIRTAVGGSDMLIYDGFIESFNMEYDFYYTPHPRTLAGYRADGKIILAVIDGRQANISNGASLERCAIFMQELGAEYALNLDGGGSSSFVTNRDGSMTYENHPSDLLPRQVYSSVIVVKNPE